VFLINHQAAFSFYECPHFSVIIRGQASVRLTARSIRRICASQVYVIYRHAFPESYKSQTAAMVSLHNNVSLSLRPSSVLLTAPHKKQPATPSFTCLIISRPTPSQHSPPSFAAKSRASSLIRANLIVSLSSQHSRIASVNSFVFSIGGIHRPESSRRVCHAHTVDVGCLTVSF
jgi:hypothetical protein